jgi:hypothetical protein
MSQSEPSLVKGTQESPLTPLKEEEAPKEPLLSKELPPSPSVVMELPVVEPVVTVAKMELPIVTTEPVVKEPVVKEPVVKEPVVKEPVEKEPVVKESVEKLPPLKDTTKETPVPDKVKEESPSPDLSWKHQRMILPSGRAENSNLAFLKTKSLGSWIWISPKLLNESKESAATTLWSTKFMVKELGVPATERSSVKFHPGCNAFTIKAKAGAYLTTGSSFYVRLNYKNAIIELEPNSSQHLVFDEEFYLQVKSVVGLIQNNQDLFSIQFYEL